MNKGVTRDRIVTAALDLLDEKGMDGVTVRALATRLDVRPSALYWHVRNKRELLDEMGTAVMRRVGSALSELPRVTTGAMIWRRSRVCCERSSCVTATALASSAARASPTRKWYG